MYACFVDISQGSVETHLWYGGIYNNRVIANCLQSVPVKEFWKLVNNWQRYRQKYGATFFVAYFVCMLLWCVSMRCVIRCVRV